MRCRFGFLPLFVLSLGLGVKASSAPEPFLPSHLFPTSGLEARVNFWKSIYAQYDRRQVVLHDRRNLAIVYKVLQFDLYPEDSSAEGERQKAEVKKHSALIVTALEDLSQHGAIAAGFTDTHKEVYEAFHRAGADMTPTALRAAATQVRDQRGVRERFELGLRRSGLFLSHIEEIFRRKGLPVELAYLPHVESSFDYGAYSKVGAAGIWQFMRGTARGLLTMNAVLDERRDPVRSTEAAATFLAKNFRLLGNWPLAITAYNHGTGGMQRARQALGDNYLTIVEKYDGKLFGFASQNFYSEFLAAAEVAHNYATYFPGVKPVDPLLFDNVSLQSLRTGREMAEIDGEVLQAYNPGILVDIRSNLRHLPQSYTLRVPPGAPDPLLATMTQRRGTPTLLPGTVRAAAQPPAKQYRVRRGDTLTKIASLFGVSLDALKMKNKALQAGRVFAGQIILLP